MCPLFSVPIVFVSTQHKVLKCITYLLTYYRPIVPSFPSSHSARWCFMMEYDLTALYDILRAVLTRWIKHIPRAMCLVHISHFVSLVDICILLYTQI